MAQKYRRLVLPRIDPHLRYRLFRGRGRDLCHTHVRGNDVRHLHHIHHPVRHCELLIKLDTEEVWVNARGITDLGQRTLHRSAQMGVHTLDQHPFLGLFHNHDRDHDLDSCLQPDRCMKV